MARRRLSPFLFVFVFAAIGLVTVGAYLLLPLGKNDVISTVGIAVVHENGTVVRELNHKSPLAIILGQNTDITGYMSSETAGAIYYLRLTPVIKPTFTAASPPTLKLTVRWDPVQVNGVNYQWVYRGTRLARMESTAVLPCNTTTTLSGITSGQSYSVSDLNAVLLLRITEGLPTPPPGQSYTITGRVTVTAVLVVDGAEQGNPVTQTATYTTTIKNQPDGTLSAVDVSVNIGTASSW